MSKLGAILLTFVLLVSTLGVSINKHYCGDFLASVSLYHDAGCACTGADDEEDGCCHNETEVFQLDVDYSIVSFDVDLNAQVVAVLASFYVELFPQTACQVASHNYYKPPNLQRDITVLVQSFLI